MKVLFHRQTASRRHIYNTAILHTLNYIKKTFHKRNKCHACDLKILHDYKTILLLCISLYTRPCKMANVFMAKIH